MGTNTLHITYLSKEGPFLKVWGQLDKNMPLAIDRALQEHTDHFNAGNCMPVSLQFFEVDCVCAAKFHDNLYYRARITDTTMLLKGAVEVLFIDYGNRDLVQCSFVRTLAALPPHFVNIPQQARDFYLSGVTYTGDTWEPQVLDRIMQQIRYHDLEIANVVQLGPHYIVNLNQNGLDVGASLIAAGLCVDVPLHIQQTLIQRSLMQKLHNQSLLASASQQAIQAQQRFSPVLPPPNTIPYTGIQQPLPVSAHVTPTASAVATPVSALSPSANTIAHLGVVETPKTLTFMPVPMQSGSEQPIYVSYVSDGPLLFAVQLAQYEKPLLELMTELNKIPLHPFRDSPTPGSPCLARSIEDEQICRAVITNMVDLEYKVFYVDFGNTEVRSLQHIFAIPQKYIIPMPMATRFTLDGLSNILVTMQMKIAFKKFVEEKELRMKVKSKDERTGIPLCDIWNMSNENALDVVRKAAYVAYPDPMPLSKGSAETVVVSYVVSCNRFYVQLKSKQIELNKMMDWLQPACSQGDAEVPAVVFKNYTCSALYQDDGRWYRAVVTDNSDHNIKVSYVDYGNEEAVQLANLRKPKYEQIVCLRKQAIKCSLYGYQNVVPDPERDSILEELLLEQEFTMKVVEIFGDTALVDLIDEQNYNVASLLIKRLAALKSQASSLLIQQVDELELTKPERYFRPRTSPRNDSAPITRSGLDFKKERDNNRSNDNFMKRSHMQQPSPEIFETFIPQQNGALPPKQNSPKERISNTSRYDRRKQSDSNKLSSDSEMSDHVSKKPTRFTTGRMYSDGLKHNHHKRPTGTGDSWDTSPPEQYLDRLSGEPSGKGDSWSPPKPDPAKRHQDHADTNDHSDISSYKSSNSQGDLRDKRNRQNDRNPRDERKPIRDRLGPPHRSSNNSDSDRTAFSKRSYRSADDRSEPEPDFAEPGAQYNYNDLVGSFELVGICWLYNPGRFYVQLERENVVLKDLMVDIQRVYKKRKPFNTAEVGQSVIAIFPADKKFYRAKILERNANGTFRVLYVDFGNTSNVPHVYNIEKSHLVQPVMAHQCKFFAIIPLASGWPNAKQLQPYLDFNNFHCEFVDKTECYSIILRNKDVSVAEKLIKDGLVLASPAELELSMLYYQEIKCMVVNVNTLSDFTVEIKTNIRVQCTINNLENAEVKHEDKLKNLVGQCVIVFFDEIADNIARVTLYDLIGNKIDIIEPNEGAADTVSPLCLLPVFVRNIIGYISHATDTHLYIQPSCYESLVATLLNSLYDQYKDSVAKESMEFNTENKFVALSPDGNWYRCCISEVSEDEVTVCYIDYGNSETVPKDNVRELLPSFHNPHQLNVAIKHICPDNTSLIDTDITLKIQYGDDGWESVLPPKEKHEPTPAAIVEAQQVEEIIVVEEIEIQKVDEPSITNEVSLCAIKDESNSVSIVLSHLDTPSQFYVQLSTDLDRITAVQDTLLAELVNMVDIDIATPGILCAALYTANNEWYRAQVLDVDDDITTVRFVDYGNTDVLKNDQKVKALPTDLLTQEQYARRCSLHIVPASSNTTTAVEDWSQESCARFEEIAFADDSASFRAEILQHHQHHADKTTTYIRLLINGQDVAEILKDENLALPMSQPVVDENVDQEALQSLTPTGFVSHVNSPSEFWIQLESAVADLEHVAEQMRSSAESYPPLADLSPGALCAAIFPEDESWYRARILTNTVAGIEVLFIDYGNSCTCTNLRELPEDIVMLPALAQKSSLAKPDGVLQWSPAAVEHFTEIVADGAAVFEVQNLVPAETTIVKLLLNGDDVTQRMLPQTVPVTISHYDSLDSFYLHEAGDESVRNDLSASLRQAETWDTVKESELETPDQIVAAYSEAKSSWLRARIIEPSKVLFVDYGHSESTSQLRKLSVEIASNTHRARQVKIVPVHGYTWGVKSEENFASLNANGTTLFACETTSNNVVQLYKDFKDIRASMDMLKATPMSSNFGTPKKTTSKTDPVDRLDIVPNTTITSLQFDNDQCAIETDNVLEHEPTSVVSDLAVPNIIEDTSAIENQPALTLSGTHLDGCSTIPLVDSEKPIDSKDSATTADDDEACRSVPTTPTKATALADTVEVEAMCIESESKPALAEADIEGSISNTPESTEELNAATKYEPIMCVESESISAEIGREGSISRISEPMFIESEQNTIVADNDKTGSALSQEHGGGLDMSSGIVVTENKSLLLRDNKDSEALSEHVDHEDSIQTAANTEAVGLQENNVCDVLHLPDKLTENHETFLVTDLAFVIGEGNLMASITNDNKKDDFSTASLSHRECKSSELQMDSLSLTMRQEPLIDFETEIIQISDASTVSQFEELLKANEDAINSENNIITNETNVDHEVNNRQEARRELIEHTDTRKEESREINDLVAKSQKDNPMSSDFANNYLEIVMGIDIAKDTVVDKNQSHTDTIDICDKITVEILDNVQNIVQEDTLFDNTKTEDGVTKIVDDTENIVDVAVMHDVKNVAETQINKDCLNVFETAANIVAVAALEKIANAGEIQSFEDNFGEINVHPLKTDNFVIDKTIKLDDKRSQEVSTDMFNENTIVDETQMIMEDWVMDSSKDIGLTGIDCSTDLLGQQCTCAKLEICEVTTSNLVEHDAYSLDHHTPHETRGISNSSALEQVYKSQENEIDVFAIATNLQLTQICEDFTESSQVNVDVDNSGSTENLTKRIEDRKNDCKISDDDVETLALETVIEIVNNVAI